MKNYIYCFLLLIFTSHFSCQSKSYPCPSYRNDASHDITMVKGPDGVPLEAIKVRRNKNGLVVSKKIEKIHRK